MVWFITPLILTNSNCKSPLAWYFEKIGYLPTVILGQSISVSARNSKILSRVLQRFARAKRKSQKCEKYYQIDLFCFALLKTLCYWEENICKQIEIPCFLTVLLSIPFNKLPWYLWSIRKWMFKAELEAHFKSQSIQGYSETEITKIEGDAQNLPLG